MIFVYTLDMSKADSWKLYMHVTETHSIITCSWGDLVWHKIRFLIQPVILALRLATDAKWKTLQCLRPQISNSGLFGKSLRNSFFPRHTHHKPYPTGCLHGADFQQSMDIDFVSCLCFLRLRVCFLAEIKRYKS